MNLRPYQHKMIDFADEHPRCAWFVEMGLGKTLAALTYMTDRTDVDRWLVVGPKLVAQHVWPTEADENRWPWLAGCRFRVLDAGMFDLCMTPKGKDFKDKAATKKKILAAIGYLTAVSYEQFPWLVRAMGASWPFDGICYDESTFLKSDSSQRYRAARRVSRAAKRVLLLTGTPAPNGYEDLFSQCYLLDQGERLGATIHEFRDRWMEPSSYGPGGQVFAYMVRIDRKAELDAKVSELSMALAAEDWLALPELVVVDVHVKLPQSALIVVNGFEDEMRACVGDTAIMAANRAAALNKCLQAANGSVYAMDGTAKPLHSAKLAALAEIVEAASGGVLVFYNYLFDAEAITAKFGKRCGVVSDAAARAAWDRGDLKVLLGHPASAGHGLNLQLGGSTAVWYGLTWNLEHYEQANARLRRPGQRAGRVVIHRLRAGTYSEIAVAAALDRKESLQGALKRFLGLPHLPGPIIDPGGYTQVLEALA